MVRTNQRVWLSLVPSLLHRGQQDLLQLSKSTLRLFFQYSRVDVLAERMGKDNEGIIWITVTFGHHASGCQYESVSPYGGHRDAPGFQRHRVDRKGRRTRTSVTHGHDHRITTVGEFLKNFRRRTLSEVLFLPVDRAAKFILALQQVLEEAQ